MKKIKLKLSVAFTLLLSFVIISCSEDDDNTADIINPYVVSFNPTQGVEGVYTSSDLVLTFNESVIKGEGNITITTDVESGKQVIDMTSDAVTIGNVGRVVTINPQDFLSGRDYKVVISQGAVKDLAGNLFGGVSDSDMWEFKTGGNTGDLDAPEISTLYPADGVTDGTVVMLTLTFNEDVKTSAGNFVIYNASDVAVATIDAESEDVTVHGAEITIALTKALDFGTAYYVNFDAGVVKDVAGNPFAGITDKTTWNYTTTAGSGSELIVHMPFDGNLNDVSGNMFNAFLGQRENEDAVDVSFEQDATRGSVINFPAGAFAVLPKHDLLRPSETQDFSINLWVKIATGTDSDPVLIGNSDWGSGSNPGILLCTDDAHEYAPGNGTDHGWIVNLAGDPKNDFRMDWKAADTSPQAPSITDGEWHMITMVLDQVNKDLRVYLDGKEYRNDVEASYHDLSTISGPLYDVTKDYPWTIWEDATGKYNAGDDRRAALTGLMDELTIYNKALSADDIAALLSK